MRKQSLRVKYTLFFITVMVAAIGICVLMNFYFLEDFYMSEKQEVLTEKIDEVNEVFNSYQFSGDIRNEVSNEFVLDMESYLNECWNKYNISVLIMDSDNNTLFNVSSNRVDLKYRLKQYLFELITEKNIEKINDFQRHEYQIVVFNDGSTGVRYVDAYGLLDNGCPFLLSTPVESIQESVTVSNRFFMITGIIVAFIAGMAIFFMTRRMTQPVLELSDIASRMAKQDFTARYQGTSQDEVGILGHSMNHLASELEKSINELKSANEQLQKDIEEKIQIDDLRKEFLSNVSHELKTPIALIQGYAEGLQDCVNDDEESRNFYCEVIMDEASKMNQMVQKLLNLNHLEFGNNACEISEFNLSEMIHGMVESTSILLEQKDGTLEYQETASSMQVTGDEFMIEEVLKNYISNACNHLSGERKIRITAADSEQGRVRVSVFNTGQPIPTEALDKVWIKFFKVDKARTREYGGSGIGLSIVKAIMEQHGCPYGVYNCENGVVFWFELPKV